MVSFIGVNGANVNPATLKLYVTNSGTTASRVQVTVRVPLQEQTITPITRTIDFGETVLIEVPGNLQNFEGGISDNGVYIDANGQISVLAANQQTGGCDAFAVLPLDALGYQYFAMLPRAIDTAGDARATISIVAVEANTDVTVKLPAGKNIVFEVDGEVYDSMDIERSMFTLSLPLYKTLTLVADSASGEVNGVYIAATQRLAVFTGSPVLDIFQAGRSDYVMTQLQASFTYGMKYILVPIPGNTKFGYQVVSGTQNTQLNINGDTFSLDDGSVYPSTGDTKDSEDPIYLTATFGVSVAQYSFSQSTFSLGSSSATLVPAMEQYNNRYVFECQQMELTMMAIYC